MRAGIMLAVMLVAMYIICVWAIEASVKIAAIHSCEDQHTDIPFMYEVHVEAPEWCVLFWDSDYYKRTRGPIQLDPRLEGCLPYTRGAC